MRHGLLIMRPIRRQTIADAMQGFPEPGDIAVTKNGPHTGKQRQSAAVGFHELLGEIAHQRLSHRQPDGTHAVPSCCMAAPPALRASQAEAKACSRDAMTWQAPCSSMTPLSQ